MNPEQLNEGELFNLRGVNYEDKLFEVTEDGINIWNVEPVSTVSFSEFKKIFPDAEILTKFTPV